MAREGRRAQVCRFRRYDGDDSLTNRSAGVPEDLRRLLAHVTAAYGLPAVVAVSQLSGGAINTVFGLRVQDSEHNALYGSPQLVLRVHRPGYRTLDQTRSELYFVEALHRKLDPTVSIPRPVPTIDADFVVEIPDEKDGLDGRRHCDLMTWVDGREVAPGQGFGPSAAYTIGAALAHVHNVSDDFVPPPNFVLPKWDTTMFSADSPYRPPGGPDDLLTGADRALFYEIADRTTDVFAYLSRERHTAGIIHGDYILGNCLIRRRGRSWHASVLDFDDCGWGYYLYDLCPVLGNMAGYPGSIAGNPRFGLLRQSYLAGYRSVRELPTEWEAHIPLLMAARNANHCLWSSNPSWRLNLARRCLELDATK